MLDGISTLGKFSFPNIFLIVDLPSSDLLGGGVCLDCVLHVLLI